MDEKNVKHLEFIQSNISRMNQNSFLVKGWMIATVSALLALYAASRNAETGTGTKGFLIVAIVPVILFWGLDSYYLQQERKFRAIYKDIIIGKNAISLFEMPLEKYKGCKYCLPRVMFTKTELLLYAPTLAVLVIAILR